MTWHVVHVITRLDLGGAQLATLYEVTHGQFARGRRSLIYGTGGILDTEVAQLTGIARYPLPRLRWEVSPLHDWRALGDIRGVLAHIKRGEPAVKLLVHTHSSKAGILGRLAARVIGADLVVHSAHGFGHNHHGSRPARWLFTAAESLAGRITDGFTGDSAATIHQGRSQGLFGSAPARVVRCGIDVDAFGETRTERGQQTSSSARTPSANQPDVDPTALRAALHVPADHRIVLNLCCLKRQKDPITYVRIAARVIESRPRTTFLLAGDGVLRSAVAAQAARLGLGDRFVLLGWRRDVPALFAAADLLLLTSRWEGLPQVFPQAMAAGVPIVATRVDGAAEAVADGDNGLLFAPGDVDGMSAAVVRLLDDEALRHEMGATGRDRAALFSQQRMVSVLEEFYRQLAG